MLQTVPSAALVGLDVVRVRVEVSITRGTPLIQVVGLPESAVREGRERIRAAAVQLGLHVPGLRITVNLAPADVRKHGAAFDLPILVGILAASGSVPGDRAGRIAMLGELSLAGDLRPVRGVLPIALHAAAAGDVEGLIVPAGNLGEARMVRGLAVLGAASLGDVIGFLRSERALQEASRIRWPPQPPAEGDAGPDLGDVRGQAAAKRALEIAAAGGHNLLLRGPPGGGKTMLARCLPGLLPAMRPSEGLEVTAIHSVAGLLPSGGFVSTRPFRAPHHTISDSGLIGGGAIPRPGEVSLAHRGVLFLDELPEFRRRALDVLRQPLEAGVVHIVRARCAVRFPARFMLVAAMNPCPCGHSSVSEHEESPCTCGGLTVRRYLRRVSGPLLDRIDLQLEIPVPAWSDLRATAAGEASARVRKRVREARARASRRGVACNAELGVGRLSVDACLDSEAEGCLRAAHERFGLSARGSHRILRVARTIADLAGRERIAAADVAEAAAYRVPCRTLPRRGRRLEG
ncbi:MAG: YifB family Mg chelatase-like AAA ATPase [Gemmatimonadota bacterium]|nr:MAG: YifB family Mg chelatase-like AAA ATPase [Gemmatimonadota bacterium]